MTARAIFSTPKKPDLDSTFSAAYSVASLIDILNFRLKKHNMTEIVVGIGLSWSNVLMVKAGYSGSGINEVVWMGKAVNEASRLASYGNRENNDQEIMVSSDFYYNLNDQNKGLLVWNSIRNCYHGNVVCKYMDDWYRQHCV
jgi:class 3 adenylate cyclase